MTVQSYDARFFYVFLPTDDGFRGLAGRASDIYGVHVRIKTVRGEREERGEGREGRDGLGGLGGLGGSICSLDSVGGANVGGGAEIEHRYSAVQDNTAQHNTARHTTIRSRVK